MRQLNEMVLADLIAARAEELPDFDVVTFEGGPNGTDEVRTYADLWTNGNRLAAGLLARGMNYGDRFGIMMRNHPEFVEAMIAASLTGTIFVPIDPRTQGRKLSFTLNNAGCRGIVCADYALAQVAEVRGDVPSLEWIWLLDSEDGAKPGIDMPAVSNIAELLSQPEIWVDARLRNADDPLQIIYTSGTTGDPKGVVFPNSRFGGGALVMRMFDIGPDERPYNGLSLTHGNAQLMTLAPSILDRRRAVFSRKFTKSRLWDIARKFGCTYFNLLGGMATALYSEPVRPDDAENPVKFVLSGGMPRGIWESFERRFDVKVIEIYGAVEGGAAFKPIGEGPIGSFGKAAPFLDIKIVDEAGEECPPGTPGELISRPKTGEAPVVNYFNNPEASAQKTEGGWLRSGDICHRDEEGWLFFDYRKGGGIRRNGDFINPSFVEAVLAEHPHVDDVYVYGIASSNGAPGEKDVVAAIFVNRDNFDTSEMLSYCQQRLERNFVPSFLQVVTEIPKTASEKPQERFLVEGLTAAEAELYELTKNKAVRLSPGHLSATGNGQHVPAKAAATN